MLTDTYYRPENPPKAHVLGTDGRYVAFYICMHSGA